MNKKKILGRFLSAFLAAAIAVTMLSNRPVAAEVSGNLVPAEVPEGVGRFGIGEKAGVLVCCAWHTGRVGNFGYPNRNSYR